jgi:Mg2+ and Co2+ transporter CorA
MAIGESCRITTVCTVFTYSDLDYICTSDDALQVEQRPKMDYYDHGVFVVVPMLRATAKVERNEVQEVVDDQKYAQVRRRSYTGGSVNDVDLSRGDSEGRNSYDGHGAGFEARNLLIEVEAVSIFVVEKERTIITIQEKPGDCWHDLRVYMKHTWSRVRGNDHNFLLYSLLDLTTDSLFPVLKEVLQCIDRLQDQLESAEGPDAGRVLNEFDVSAVQNVKKQLLCKLCKIISCCLSHLILKILTLVLAIWCSDMHRMLRPMRSVLDKALVDGSVSDGSASSLNKYFLDVQSHMTQILEDVEEGISECRDLTEAYNTKVAGYQSAQADRQSQVLYMLTFVTILIAPLQILTGLYGMNFAVIPELEWKYGYLYFWSLAIFLMLLLGLIFKYMGWLKAAPYDKN